MKSTETNKGEKKPTKIRTVTQDDAKFFKLDCKITRLFYVFLICLVVSLLISQRKEF